MRLFIAIQLSEEMRQAIVKVQDAFVRRGIRGNYTPKENLHLTLAFIGEYPDAEPVLEVLESVPVEPFTLTLGGIGAFGALWWIGLERSEALTSYVRALRHALAEAGIPFDGKRFSPHITMLRRASVKGGRLPAIELERVSMLADRASLMRSDRGKHGMIYTEIR